MGTWGTGDAGVAGSWSSHAGFWGQVLCHWLCSPGAGCGEQRGIVPAPQLGLQLCSPVCEGTFHVKLSQDTQSSFAPRSWFNVVAPAAAGLCRQPVLPAWATPQGSAVAWGLVLGLPVAPVQLKKQSGVAKCRALAMDCVLWDVLARLEAKVKLLSSV